MSPESPVKEPAKPCAYCNKPLDGMRADARYCSDSCRVLAYRKRTREGATLPMANRPSSSCTGDGNENSR